MSFLELRGLTKRYEAMAAANAVSFGVEEGEFLSILGPSGCGKTTTLRMLAGLIEPDDGEIILDGREITYLPPEKRDMALVFQNYALFPHMTVADNVAFGLRMRRLPTHEISTRVDEALALVQMTQYRRRLPAELSGGQQQRIALARALVTRPKVLLLDEPLSNLDAKLRAEMRFELKRIQRSTGLTTVFVTHDQEEALALSDRLIVMNGGSIAQIGAPKAIYENPTSAFVAGFIGSVNRLCGTFASGPTPTVRLASGTEIPGPPGASFPEGAAVELLVRPERISVGEAHSQAPLISVEATLTDITYTGSTVIYHSMVGDQQVLAFRLNDGQAASVSPGQPVILSWDPASCYVFTD